MTEVDIKIQSLFKVQLISKGLFGILNKRKFKIFDYCDISGRLIFIRLTHQKDISKVTDH